MSFYIFKVNNPDVFLLVYLPLFYSLLVINMKQNLPMSILAKDKLLNKIFTVLRRESATHILFWTILFLVFTLVEGSKGDLWFTIQKEVINISFFALIVYINIIYIFPKYVVLKDQLYIFFSTFLVGISSSIYSIVRDWLRSQREKQELQKQTLKSELRFLKSQINPHFLFNTLNNLYALTLKKSDLAPEIVLKLSEMMRYMLYECNERKVPLSKEVNYLKNYLELEKLRQGKKFKTNLIVEGDIDGQMIAPLMFIPFVENSFKHGISNSISEGYVNIEILVSDQDIQINIENSKAMSLPSPNKKKSGGIGLVNVRRRLDLLYPEDYVLDIQDSPNQYRVELGLTLDH